MCRSSCWIRWILEAQDPKVPSEPRQCHHIACISKPSSVARVVSRLELYSSLVDLERDFQNLYVIMCSKIETNFFDNTSFIIIIIYVIVLPLSSFYLYSCIVEEVQCCLVSGDEERDERNDKNRGKIFRFFFHYSRLLLAFPSNTLVKLNKASAQHEWRQRRRRNDDGTFSCQ